MNDLNYVQDQINSDCYQELKCIKRGHQGGTSPILRLTKCFYRYGDNIIIMQF